MRRGVLLEAAVQPLDEAESRREPRWPFAQPGCLFSCDIFQGFVTCTSPLF
jgi:hypothetical protein